jgi:hypothetical protein
VGNFRAVWSIEEEQKKRGNLIRRYAWRLGNGLVLPEMAAPTGRMLGKCGLFYGAPDLPFLGLNWIIAYR